VVVQCHFPGALRPGKSPATHCTGGWVNLNPVCAVQTNESLALVKYLSVRKIFQRSVVGKNKEDFYVKYAFFLRFMVFETKTVNIPEVLSYEYI
jgi:hypothetical protein